VSGGSTVTTRYFGPHFEVETRGSLMIYRHYVFAGGRAVAQIERRSSGSPANDIQYLHRDHLASVVATTSAAGVVRQCWEYDAFGIRSRACGSGVDDTERGYTGHEHLDAVELTHMKGRVQDPELGRFISADPFVQAPYNGQSLNRYSYVWNNPATFVDPSGFATSSVEVPEHLEAAFLFPFYAPVPTWQHILTSTGSFGGASAGDEGGPPQGSDAARNDRGFMGQQGGGSSSLRGGGETREVAEIIYVRQGLGRQVGEPRVFNRPDEERIRFERIPTDVTPFTVTRGAILGALVEGLAKDIANDFYRLKFTDTVRVVETETTHAAYYLQVENVYAEPGHTWLRTSSACCDIRNVVDVHRSEQIIHVDRNGEYVRIESVPYELR
jgi:RHS repeat-associated protein